MKGSGDRAPLFCCKEPSLAAGALAFPQRIRLPRLNSRIQEAGARSPKLLNDDLKTRCCDITPNP